MNDNANKQMNKISAGMLVTLSLKNPAPTAAKSPQPAGFSEYKTDFTQKLSLKVFKTFEIATTNKNDGKIKAKVATIPPIIP